jgi:hypothetical protein
MLAWARRHLPTVLPWFLGWMAFLLGSHGPKENEDGDRGDSWEEPGVSEDYVVEAQGPTVTGLQSRSRARAARRLHVSLSEAGRVFLTGARQTLSSAQRPVTQAQAVASDHCRACVSFSMNAGLFSHREFHDCQ